MKFSGPCFNPIHRITIHIFVLDGIDSAGKMVIFVQSDFKSYYADILGPKKKLEIASATPYLLHRVAQERIWVTLGGSWATQGGPASR